ncbi:FAD-dependent oxidoreductase [Sulfitobacter mediterraneus]|uniref:NAD(P)/FAD-dependent oxidoreductase n=1 Tax=Sulfitobacter mediterraneus TaxID=83219 RepID=UPI00193204F0|nr:FAD-dependent oxidoreductase [Sulfitobacter mediterraneus]MBM1633139.1 FAD-dependent oxidoreductase [Sulfitobacter mediterraneus]MBM1640727.1 FAD-dependent oxidoreductase [Sulfitobacter mediterraneus]MBM1645004.1 FAD-dependent oxidoreductase [Sulfitobacter mediterraneus]MBM1648847.1 FAD-dependent oxidoreductase [Sulfitobacter mediterraneus]MBM1652868.1 FAD-dependent oxidoreductase [Sulfitobacter mediterraneus]
MTGHCVVIGAGIVGVSTAIWLRRAGVEVTVIDRGAPGTGTSHGNAGVLASCAMVPVTGPGLLRKAPGMLLDRDFPLFLRWSYLPRLLPWLRKYLAVANDTDTRRIAKGLTTITGDSVEQHKSLCDELGLGDWVSESEYCFAYNSRAAFEAEHYVWELRKEAGFEPRLIEGAEVHDYEPALGPQINTLAVMKDHGFIRSPGGYVQALAKAFEGMGGTIMKSEVKDFDLFGGQVRGVQTSEGTVPCDNLVLATGVWSKPLMKKLGLNIPLEAERGYHIVFEDASGGPARPTMIASGKFVATPMEQGLRCAGIVELGGLEAGPSPAPLALLRRQARAAFPGLKATNEIEWLGHRPAPSDSLPLIGEVGNSRVFTAFGHHHIGLTGGPKTGRLVAGLITGQAPNTDLTPYHPQRFD